MTIRDLLESAKCAYTSERANLVCEILLAHFLGKNRVFLHTNSEKNIQDILDANHNYTQCVELWQLNFLPQDEFALETILLKSISRLNDGYPLEYITKKASFYGMDFFVDEGVLIPRPETELLVDKAMQLIGKYSIQQIYEIGTGSGIIAIMLCLLNSHITITATDISSTALKITQKNIALKCKLDSTLATRIRLIHADLLQGVDFVPKNSLIISNPPYIANDYALPKNVAFEPKIALFGGKNGDEIMQRIIALNADFLCCEIGYNQGYLAEFLGAYKSVEFYKDYAGFVRGFIAKH